MLIIILIMIILIYHASGLLGVLAIIVWALNLFCTTMLLIQDPNNTIIKILRIISIFSIIYIIFTNLNILDDNISKLSFIIPLSINKISYLEDIMEDSQNNIFYLGDVAISIFYFGDSKEISDFLKNLDSNKTYIVTFELIFDWDAYEIGEPSLVLSKPILVTKESNSQLISDYIIERSYSACDLYSLDEIIWKDFDQLGILVRFKEINLFWK